MSTDVYSEPYKLPAGILALIVHGAFFALLYFGFSWQTEQPVAMSVELWQSMPEPVAAPPVVTKVEKVVPPPVKVEEVIKPDIVIHDKKPKPEVVKPPEKKPEVKPDVKPVAKPEVKKPTDTKKVSDQPAKPTAAEQQAALGRAAQETEIGIYKGKISAKIRSNVVKPPDVADDARAEFSVTLLPGGRVMSARLTKSSGNAAYDNAVERAILKSDPLPLPSDTSLFSQFRELKLSFKPVE
jgi:colicin import membrane protein